MSVQSQKAEPGFRYDKQRRTLIPRSKGFYWGKWRIKVEGTADENERSGDEWEVMHVVENCIDNNDPEFLMVMVPGVEKWQPLENFVWGVVVPAHS